MRTIKWLPQAIEGQQEVLDYILAEFGVDAAIDFQEKVEKAEMLIANNPHLFPIDRLANNGKYEYRSLVINKRSKMLYVEHDNSIIVVDFWDVRQEPTQHFL